MQTCTSVLAFASQWGNLEQRPRHDDDLAVTCESTTMITAEPNAYISTALCHKSNAVQSVLGFSQDLELALSLPSRDDVRMLSDLQSPDFSALAVCSLLSLVVWYVIQRTRHELRIRKIGGVRAPSVGTNPLSGKQGKRINSLTNAILINIWRRHLENRRDSEGPHEDEHARLLQRAL